MKTPNRAEPRVRPVASPSAPEPKHLMDYVRVVYKRRWIAFPVFLIFLVVGAVNALRQVPVYQGRAQVLIESDSPKVARLDQVFQSNSG